MKYSVVANIILDLVEKLYQEKDEKTYEMIPVDKKAFPDTALDFTYNDNKEKTEFYFNEMKFEKIKTKAKYIPTILAKYEAQEYYGVLAKIEKKVFNPMNAFKTINFMKELDKCKEDDIIELIFYKTNKLETNETKIENLKDKIRNALYFYIYQKENVKISEEVEEDEKNNAFIKIMKGYNQEIKTEQNIDKEKELIGEDKEIILFIDLATSHITFPYYASLGIALEKHRNDYLMWARNLSSNFLSGNLIPPVTNYKKLATRTFDENDEELNYYENELFEYDQSLCYSNGDDNIDLDYLEDITTLEKDEDYFINDLVEAMDYYEGEFIKRASRNNQICFGTEESKIINIDVLENMNLNSMYFENTLGNHFLEEAIAHQKIAQELIKEKYEIKD